MKQNKYTYFILALLGIFSLMYRCDSSPEKSITIHTNGSLPTNIHAEQEEELQGFWLNETYLKQIESSKSVFKNRFNSSLFFGCIIGKMEEIKDTFLLKGISTTREDIDSYLTYDRTKHIFHGELTLDEKPQTYELYLVKDHLLKMYFTNQKLTQDFRKVENEQVELRRILFEGNYFSKDKKLSYRFDKSGKINGLSDYVYYEVLYDFDGGVNFDALLLYKTSGGGPKDEADLFKYEFKKGVLNLTYVESDWILENHRISDSTVTMIKI
jgi:hypothetical protein